MNGESISDEVVYALVEAALKARGKAYAPYSQFAVGAALLSEDGVVTVGCNVENASYPLGICAERAAIAAAIVRGYRSFQAIAVAGAGDRPLSPCGGCRQVLSEFGELWVIGAAAEGTGVRRWRLSQLLPERFGEERL